MIALTLSLILAQPLPFPLESSQPPAPELWLGQPQIRPRIFRNEGPPRIERNDSIGTSFAAFEAFPADGTGTFGTCSTTPPTGVRGEPLIFTRTSSATCSPAGRGTSGIANNSLITLTSAQPRVVPGSDAVNGLQIERAATNLLLRFILLTDVTWSDVGTPSLTGGQTSPWSGTYATSAVAISDDDGAAFEGRTQNVTVTSGQPYYMHCYVKAGTATSARISLDGATTDITGLSASTWSIIERDDPAASSTSIAAQVLVGNAASVTGSVVFGGCQVELGLAYTSIIPTEGAAVTRADELAGFDLGAGFPYAGNNFSMAMTNSGYADSLVAVAASGYWSVSPLSFGDSSGRGAWAYQNVNGQVCIAYDDAANAFVSGFAVASSSTGAKRWSCWSSGAVQGNYAGTSLTPSAQTGTFSALRYFNLGNTANGAGFIRPGIYSQVCIDGSSRCR